MEGSLPWGIQFIGFARPHRALWLEIATLPLIAFLIWIFHSLTPELHWAQAVVLAFSAPTGAMLAFLGGRRVLVNTQRVGYVLSWWGRFRRLGALTSFLPLLVYLAIWFAARPFIGEATALAAISAVYFPLGGLFLGYVFGLIGFELKTGVGLWYRTGIEDRKGLFGRVETRVYYARPKGYRPDRAERTFPGQRPDSR